LIAFFLLQGFELSWRQDIRPKGRELCFDVPKRDTRTPVILFSCHGMRGNQHFVYDPKTHHILHVSTRLCLDCDTESKIIFMEQCDTSSKTQQWSFRSYNETLILKDLKQFFS
jgi:polypeptide N-acetylgalactosaminyltransferase